MDIKKKYRINELLNRLPVNQYKKAVKILPAQLGIPGSTFNYYRNIEVEATQDIPHTIVAKLEQFFCVQPGELQNFQTDMRPITEMDKLTDEEINNHFQLSKPWSLK